MGPICLISNNDPDVVRLYEGLRDDFDVAHVTRALAPDELANRLAAAYIVQPVIGASVLAPPSGQERVPVIGLLDPRDLEGPELWRWDDFIVRPWPRQEVAARLRRLLSASEATDEPGVLRWDGLTLDLGRHEVRSGEAYINLTYTEFRLLAFLLGRGGRVATREACYREVWNAEHYGGLRTVDVHIRRLRSKLEAEGCLCIATVRNVGYRMVHG